MRAPRNCAGDVTKSEKTQCLAHEAGDFQQLRTAFPPAALPHHAVLLDKTTKCPQQQGHSVISHFLDEGVGDVGHRNTAGRCRRDIDQSTPTVPSAMMQHCSNPSIMRLVIGIPLA